MRPSRTLFAAVRSASKYLEANAPTGLTGLTTHPLPRPALIYTYKATLAKLSEFPESSVYRQSVEALTKHRLAIVEAEKPAGYDSWVQETTKQISKDPRFESLRNKDGSLTSEKVSMPAIENWDGTYNRGDARSEGSNSQAEADKKAQAIKEEVDAAEKLDKDGELPTLEILEPEPALTAEQISAIENKIGAGLIEEVLQVAEGELDLAQEMLKAKPWESLEEAAPAGQWEYFERGNRV